MGWITSDPSSWDLNNFSGLGDRIYHRIGVDLKKDGSGTVDYYYFYR